MESTQRYFSPKWVYGFPHKMSHLNWSEIPHRTQTQCKHLIHQWFAGIVFGTAGMCKCVYFRQMTYQNLPPSIFIHRIRAINNSSPGFFSMNLPKRRLRRLSGKHLVGHTFAMGWDRVEIDSVLIEEIHSSDRLSGCGVARTNRQWELWKNQCHFFSILEFRVDLLRRFQQIQLADSSEQFWIKQKLIELLVAWIRS